MEYRGLDIHINPWQGRTYEIVARAGPDSARQLTRFPLSPAALETRLLSLRKVLSAVDLGAGRGSSEDERAVEEFAGLLYRFVFSGEVQRLLEETRRAAVAEWKGLRLGLRVSAADLQPVPWEVLWDILAFDLRSMRRSLFDLRVERPDAATAGGQEPTPSLRLRPTCSAEHPKRAATSTPQPETAALLREADAAFYSPDFERAAELYRAALDASSSGPDLRQAQESLARIEACLAQRQPATSVPPRAAAGYRRAWELYSMYRFEEALRWLDQAWLLAKDWGIAEWPEAAGFRRQVERSLSGYANYCAAIARFQAGDLPAALEAVAQAFRADPLEVYRAQLETWGHPTRPERSEFDPDGHGKTRIGKERNFKFLHP